MCKILVKIGQVVSAENRLTDGNCAANISGYTGPIFTIFSPYASDVCADNGSVPYFPICQGTLPWQPK